MDALHEVGKRIAARRRKRELRQVDLAKLAGISRATLEALENGRARDIRWLNLTRILHALDLELIVQPKQARRPTLYDLMAEMRKKDERSRGIHLAALHGLRPLSEAVRDRVLSVRLYQIGRYRSLLARPLSMLSAADLTSYAFSAITTQGTVNDFRYFLPRLLQGVLTDLDTVCPETIFHKLTYAEWRTWPVVEVEAVKSFLKSFWNAGLQHFPMSQNFPTFYDVDSLLCSIAQTGEALDPYLHVWTQTATTAASALLVQFVTENGTEFAEGATLQEGFWGNAPTQAAELRRWLLRPDTMQRVFDSASLVEQDGLEHLFNPALSILRHEVNHASTQ